MSLSQMERQWLILSTMSQRHLGVTVKELSEEYGVVQKTIRRDLEMLKSLGFPLQERVGKYGKNHWSCPQVSGLSDLRFDITELLSLYLSREMLRPLAGTFIWSGSSSVMTKIRATLTEEQLSYLQQLRNLVYQKHFGISHYDGKELLIDDLIVASEDRRIVQLTYQSNRSTEPLTYYVHPYGIVHYKNSLYLIAYSQHHQEVRNFKIDRVSEVQLEGLKFEKPKNFELRQYVANTFGIFQEAGTKRFVRLRFDEQVSQYVQEQTWHESQQLQRNSRGQLIVTFELTGFAELKSWLLGFGALVEILEPLDWREELHQELQNTLAIYTKRKQLRD